MYRPPNYRVCYATGKADSIKKLKKLCSARLCTIVVAFRARASH